MAISMLNTMFAKHHRIIFGVFSIIIIIAFLDFLTPGSGIIDTFRSDGRAQAAGEVFGKKVTYADLVDQSRTDLIYYEVFENIKITSELRDNMTQLHLYNLACMEAARRAGISVSDEEIGKFLRNSFRDETGKFNKDNYMRFVDSYLSAQGLNQEDLVNAARQKLTILKLKAAHVAGIVFNENEKKLYGDIFKEEFETVVADFKTSDFTKTVKVEADALKAYFEANRTRYTIPARAKALVVEYPYSKYRSQAIKEVKDPQIKEFYDKNPQLFSVMKNGKMEVEPFAKVKNNARSSAIAERARMLAINAAQKFAVNAYEKVGNVPAEERLKCFKTVVAAEKLAAVDTGMFTADSSSAGKIAEPALVSELIGVFSGVPVSNAVPGKTAAYVGYVVENIPSRNAELKEVRAQATADYIKLEAEKAARKAAEKMSAQCNALAFAKRMAQAKSLTGAFAKFRAVKKFNLMTGSPDLGYASLAVAKLQPGEFTDVVTAADGSQLIMLVARKVPANVKSELNMDFILRATKAQQLEAGFEAYISSNCKKFEHKAEAQSVAE